MALPAQRAQTCRVSSRPQGLCSGAHNGTVLIASLPDRNTNMPPFAHSDRGTSNPLLDTLPNEEDFDRKTSRTAGLFYCSRNFFALRYHVFPNHTYRHRSGATAAL